MLGFSPIASEPIGAALFVAGTPGEEQPPPPPPSGHGFEMVTMEPTWRRALRLRAEKAEKVEFARKARKRAELIEKLAAKAVLSDKPDDEIKERIGSLLSEWVELAPKLELNSTRSTSPDSAFLSRVAENIRRLDLEDDEQAAIMLLLMYAA